jgi:hypothetical protein
MIHTPDKPFQVALWAGEEHGATAPALRMEFDTLDAAQAEFQRQQRSGEYRSGILFQWRKTGGTWDLLERFPD